MIDSYVFRADATTGSKRKWFKYLTDAKIQVIEIVVKNLFITVWYMHVI